MNGSVKRRSHSNRQESEPSGASLPRGLGSIVIRTLIAIAGAAAIAVSGLSIPPIAAAQPYQPPADYGSGDVCRQAKDDAANKGTVIGAILGGIFGAGVAGRHHQVAGAVVGGTAGAVAGHEIGKHSIHCVNYPSRISYHRSNCHWVEDPDWDHHQFEVCRDPDGVWRPSGRD